MKRYWILVVAVTVVAFCTPHAAHAQSASFQVTSVTSSTVPVNIMPVAKRATYACKTLSSASGPVDVWTYAGSTTPGSKPTNYTVINTGDAIGDSIQDVTNPEVSHIAINAAWAAVLDSGSSAVTVFCWWR